MNEQDIKAKILADVTAAKEQGYTIVSSSWGNIHNKCACPLGCVSLAAGGEYPQDVELVAETLNHTPGWLMSFTDGFDANGREQDATYPEAWNLGAALRQELNPVDIMTFEAEVYKARDKT